MGLLDKVSKKSADSDKEQYLDMSKIKKQVEKSIKNQEHKKVEEPTFHLKDNKIHTLRPKGSFDQVKEEKEKIKDSKLRL